MTDVYAMVLLLAEDAPSNTGPEFGKASPVGLLVVLLLLLATFGLVWSMNRHLKKLPKTLGTEDPGPESTDPPRQTGG
ncbi:hypothetical protein [uncultured Mycolicibacterium sp.]|uniref:hypothetical protein n=1 Tax=uncultured Mycolicibacterium sp. TaxID=2320817 RepID=UPI00260E655D|nr:hypothetical protein [uncultured Mycolicibacterium sp.]